MDDDKFAHLNFLIIVLMNVDSMPARFMVILTLEGFGAIFNL